MVPLLLRIYGERQDNQWVLMCLDFSLAVQADSLAEAQAKIKEQVQMYVRDVAVGPDQEHAEYLLRRRAPLKYWVKFYFYRVVARLCGPDKKQSHVASIKSAPLVPAFA